MLGFLCSADLYLIAERMSEDLFMMVPNSIANRMLYYPPIKSVKQVAGGYLQAPSSTEVWYSFVLGYRAFDLGGLGLLGLSEHGGII